MSRKVYCISCLCNQHNYDAPAVFFTPKQIDLQVFFVTTAALLCQPPQSILTKQIQTKLMLCKPLFIIHGRVKAF